jgi:hypothetical protein
LYGREEDPTIKESALVSENNDHSLLCARYYAMDFWHTIVCERNTKAVPIFRYDTEIGLKRLTYSRVPFWETWKLMVMTHDSALWKRAAQNQVGYWSPFYLFYCQNPCFQHRDQSPVFGFHGTALFGEVETPLHFPLSSAEAPKRPCETRGSKDYSLRNY